MRAYLAVVCALVFLGSCGTEERENNVQNGDFVARVRDAYLLPENIPFALAGDDPGGKNKRFRMEFIEGWVCKQLLIRKGEAMKVVPACSSDKSKATRLGGIERQIIQFREDLLAHLSLDALVKQKLDVSVSQVEIANYYSSHRDDFALNHDIVQGLFVAMPKKAPHIHAIKALMLSKKAGDGEKLQSYCAPYAATVRLSPAKWLAWEEVLATLGYRPPRDVTRLLKTNKFIHVAGQRHIYFLRIDAYRTAQETAPLELESVQNRIRSILLQQRRLELAKKIKADLLQEAKEKKVYVIRSV